MQWVANTLHTTSEHGVSSITTADAAHLGCQQSTELTPTGRFKWTRPFRAKDEIWFLRVCHHISTQNGGWQGVLTVPVDRAKHNGVSVVREPKIKLYNKKCTGR